jgi:hypothetical protein
MWRDSDPSMLHVEELEELQDIIEYGRDWIEIDAITVRYARRQNRDRRSGRAMRPPTEESPQR